jgi:ribosomal protein S18 acetylase RimI-like enzyme
VNVAWDGSAHAFILDTVVALEARHQGVGAGLVAEARRRAQAAGCEWLHVDFEDEIAPFYLEACGFRPTRAGLIRLDG